MRAFIIFIPALALMAQNPSGDLVGPQTARRVNAKYTELARSAGLQGTVSLYVEVDRDGRPSTVNVMQGLGLGLDEEAVNAVKRLTFNSGYESPEVDVPFRLDPPAVWSVESEAYRIADPGQHEIEHPTPADYTAPDPKACREYGKTQVEFTVGADGAPHGVHVLDGSQPMSEAAAKAVESWHFVPAKIDGKPGAVTARVTFVCRAEEAPPFDTESSLRYRVGGMVNAPVLLSKVEPEYSPQARAAKLQGTSVLYVEITPDGKATGLRVIKSLGMGLDQKAMESVKQWRFKPGTKGGHPVTVEATIEVNFRLL